MQEACRKDVERCFGILQAQFAIVKGPCRLWCERDMGSIMKTCVILRNMTIEDERGEKGLDFDFDEPSSSSVTLSRDPSPEFAAFLRRHHAIRDTVKHYQLRDDLIEHLWQRKGENEE